MQKWRYYRLLASGSGVVLAKNSMFAGQLQQANIEPKEVWKKEFLYYENDILMFLGQNGWELVAVTVDNVASKNLYFKRPQTE